MAKHRAGSVRVRHLQLAEPEPAPTPEPVAPDEQLLSQLAQALMATGPVAGVAAGVSKVLLLDKAISKGAVQILLELSGVGQVLSAGPSPVRLPEPVRAQARHELLRRGAYLLNAARRLSAGLRDGQLGSALATERTYLAQHRAAVDHRMLAAKQVAGQVLAGVAQDGMLGWYARMDERTSAECRAANGRNFNPAKIPVIGYPGAVHPACRCLPGPPHEGAAHLEGSGPAARINTEVALNMREGVTRARQVLGDRPRVLELVKSAAYPDLERKPGKQNWVDHAGGLPDYIERIAKHLHYEQGMSISRAIATAVSTVKRWAAGGGDVKPDTRAKAAKAVAEWEAKKAASHTN